jgi:hypothetical protein
MAARMPDNKGGKAVLTAFARFPGLRALLLTALAAAAAPASAEENDFWWWIHGFEITPGAGLRHLGVDVRRKSDSFQGNSSNGITSSLFASINIESPSYQFGKSNFGVSVYAYAANVNLDEQFYADPNQSSGSASATGERKNVGTSLSGYYSYIVPTLHYRNINKDGSSFKLALGYGRWSGQFSGDIILTPDNRPAAGMPKTPIDTRISKNAYLFLMQYKFANRWQAYMSVGGPKWQDANFNYQLEEVSLIIGYTFVL